MDFKNINFIPFDNLGLPPIPNITLVSIFFVVKMPDNSLEVEVFMTIGENNIPSINEMVRKATLQAAPYLQGELQVIKVCVMDDNTTFKQFIQTCKIQPMLQFSGN